MTNFLLGLLCGWVLLSFIHEGLWGQRFMNLIQLPYLVITGLLEVILVIILFPFIFLWKLVRNVIRPVKSEAIQNLKLREDSKHLFGPIYFCHDKKAKRLANKFFFYRVKNS